MSHFIAKPQGIVQLMSLQGNVFLSKLQQSGNKSKFSYLLVFYYCMSELHLSMANRLTTSIRKVLSGELYRKMSSKVHISLPDFNRSIIFQSGVHEVNLKIELLK